MGGGLPCGSGCTAPSVMGPFHVLLSCISVITVLLLLWYHLEGQSPHLSDCRDQISLFFAVLHVRRKRSNCQDLVWLLQAHSEPGRGALGELPPTQTVQRPRILLEHMAAQLELCSQTHRGLTCISRQLPA